MSISDVLRDVLAVIKPTEKEKIEEEVLARRLKEKLMKKVPRGATIELAGSVAKGTFLRDSRDIDLFILVGMDTEKKRLEGIAKKAALSAFPNKRYEIKYAEHPYVRLYTDNRRIDIVPAYRIKHMKDRLSAVDRSVLHTQFVLRNLKKKQIDDVLLFKKFLKANELYGAEIRVQGFSGYLCELLIIKYKGFVPLMKLLSKWKAPVFIDIKRHYRKKDEIAEAVKRFGAPIIVIDPVDPNRNVAAAVSIENMRRLVTLARRFLKRPSTNFFLKPVPSFEEKIAAMKKRKGTSYLITLPAPDVVDDVLWGQLRRFEKTLLAYLKKNDLVVREHICDSNGETVRIALRFAKAVLPEERLVKGPRVRMKKNARDFLSAHKGERIVTKRGRLYAIVKREITDAGIAIKKFLTTAKLPSHLASAKKADIRKVSFR